MRHMGSGSDRGIFACQDTSSRICASDVSQVTAEEDEEGVVSVTEFAVKTIREDVSWIGLTSS